MASAAVASSTAAMARIGSPLYTGSFVNAASDGSGGAASDPAGFGGAGKSSAVRMPLTPGMASASRASIRRTRQCGIGLNSSLQNTMPSAR